MGRRISLFLSALVFFVVAMASVMNVFVDVPALEFTARDAACKGQQNCSAGLRSIGRNPLGRSYVFDLSRSTVEVWCTRDYIVWGDYKCSRTNQPSEPAAPSASTKPSASSSAKSSAK
jgi:hypothetical protein